MTPAAILFCTTLVTAVPHGSIAQQDCRFVDPPFTGSRTTAQDVPVRSGMNSNSVLPTRQFSQVAQVATIAPVAPVVPVAEPISKPVVKIVRLYKQKVRRRVAHLTTFRRYGKFMVSPTAIEIPKKNEQYTFWEKLKRFDLFK